jgi:hypothetical protein
MLIKKSSANIGIFSIEKLWFIKLKIRLNVYCNFFKIILLLIFLFFNIINYMYINFIVKIF